MAHLKRSLIINGHATSVSLEQEFWDVLHAISQKEGVSIAKIIQRLDDERTDSLHMDSPMKNLSSRLRVFILSYVLALQSQILVNNKGT
jgi:predicted DNA-binding ribbon-helix-helix protein